MSRYGYRGRLRALLVEGRNEAASDESVVLVDRRRERAKSMGNAEAVSFLRIDTIISGEYEPKEYLTARGIVPNDYGNVWFAEASASRSLKCPDSPTN